MANKKRLPKGEYFMARYNDAVERGLNKKADYYKGRLVEMGVSFDKKTVIKTTKLGKLIRTEISNPNMKGSIVIFGY